MRRGDLADLNAFLTVADRLSFRAASAQLGVTASALSHSMRQLEERLGVRLLHRTTRSVSLTDAGHRLREELLPAVNQIAGALENLNKQRQRPFGRLRVHASHLAATAVIAPMWQRFLSTYPDVHLDLWVETRPIDLVANGFDAGVGAKHWVPADMIAVRLAPAMKVAVVGSPRYFEQKRPPRTPDDLAAHMCIEYRLTANGTVTPWSFERNGKTRRMALTGPVAINSPELAVRAALDGVGIAYTLDCLAAPFLRSGELVRVLESFSPLVEPFFLYYPGHRQVPAALRAFIDMVRTPKAAHGQRATKSPSVKD